MIGGCSFFVLSLRLLLTPSYVLHVGHGWSWMVMDLSWSLTSMMIHIIYLTCWSRNYVPVSENLVRIRPMYFLIYHIYIYFLQIDQDIYKLPEMVT